MLRCTTTLYRTRVQPSSDMKHKTTRHFTPMPLASAAAGVELSGRRKAAPNAFGVRLFKA